MQHGTANKGMKYSFKHAFILHWQRTIFVIRPYTLTGWGWIWVWISETPCRPLPWSNRWLRLDTTGEVTMEGYVFTSLTKLDQRLAWERKKWCFSKYVCLNRAFDLSLPFLHAQGTNSTQNPSQGVNLLVLEGWKRFKISVLFYQGCNVNYWSVSALELSVNVRVLIYTKYHTPTTASWQFHIII